MLTFSAIARAFGEKAPWFTSKVMSYHMHNGKNQRDEVLAEIKVLRKYLDDIEAGIQEREQMLIASGFDRS